MADPTPTCRSVLERFVRLDNIVCGGTHDGQPEIFDDLIRATRLALAQPDDDLNEQLAAATKALCESQRQLDAATKRAEAAEKRVQTVRDWYASRWERLRTLIPKGSILEKEACDIMANGHLLGDISPASPVTLAVQRAEAAERKIDEAVGRAEAAENRLRHAMDLRCNPAVIDQKNVDKNRISKLEFLVERLFAELRGGAS